MNVGTRMTCQRFERQVSDWLGRRLSSAHSEAMAAHEQECAPCRRAARAEGDLRRCFFEAVPPPTLPELWPRLALHLEAAAPAKTGLLPQRWAVAAAIALLALTACWSHLPGGTGAGKIGTAGAKKTLPAPVLTASSAGSSPSRQAPAWSALGNAAQDDPAVDDPVGPNMETTWTCLNADK